MHPLTSLVMVETRLAEGHTDRQGVSVRVDPSCDRILMLVTVV